MQKPVYYASRALRGVEERYPPMVKLAFALLTEACKLKPYFQAHTVIVLTDRPLRRAMSNPEAAGRLALWVIELSEFGIQYCPWTAIKGQIIVDFIAEFTNDKDKGAEESSLWSIHTDGSPNRQAGGGGGLAPYYCHSKGTRLNVWFVLTSPPPTMKWNTKH